MQCPHPFCPTVSPAPVILATTTSWGVLLRSTLGVCEGQTLLRRHEGCGWNAP